VYELADEFGFTAHVRGRGEEAQAIKREAGFRARRWVVERTHSWLNRFGRILTRWEKRADTYLAMLHLACGLITWRAANWEPLSEWALKPRSPHAARSRRSKASAVRMAATSASTIRKPALPIPRPWRSGSEAT
jgi:hypothetical protein